jgi:hypothetical protein
MQRKSHTGLNRSLLGVAGIFLVAACASPSNEPSGESAVSNVPEALLAAVCDTTGGNLTLALAAGEVGYVGRTAGCTVEPCVFANAVTSTGAICRVNSTGKSITVTGAAGVEKMVVDYSAGLFASATTSTPLISVTLGGAGSKLMVVAPNALSNMALGVNGLDANTLSTRLPARVDIAIAANIDVLINGGTGVDTFTADAAAWTSAILPAGWDTGANIVAAVGTAFTGSLTVNGGAGDDKLAGGAGTNSLLGGAGNDTFMQGTTFRAEIINGGDGIDTVDYGVRTLPVGVSVGTNAGISTATLGASGGSGYVIGEILTVGGGTGGTVTVDATGIAAATVGTSGGTGYVVGEVLTVAGGAGTVTVATLATAPMSTAVLGASGGTGYTMGDILTVAGGTGGTVTVSGEAGGVISAVTLTTAGTGYSAGTNRATTGGTGTGANIDLTTPAAVGTVTVTTAGSGTTYPSVDNATTASAAGTGALITVGSARVVGTVTLTKTGSGYVASVGNATTSNLAGTGALITVGSAAAADDGDLAAAEGDAVSATVEIIKGGAGNDALTAYAVTTTDVVLIGNAGNDTLTGGSGNDDLCGGTGDDTFVENLGNDNLSGGAGIDTANYSAGTGVIACLNATDQVAGKPCATQNGATGEKDVVNAVLLKVCPRATLTIDVAGVPTAGVAVPTLSQGGAMAVDVENLTGNATAANSLYCGTLACTLFGGSAADTLWGGAATDVIVGKGGADTVKTMGGADLVDFINGGAAATQTLDCNSNAVTVLISTADTKAFTACSSANVP